MVAVRVHGGRRVKKASRSDEIAKLQAQLDKLRGLKRAKRKKHDTYLTDPRCARAIIEALQRLFPSRLGRTSTPRVLEPSAGKGAFCSAVRDMIPGAVIRAVEIQQKFHNDLLESGADSAVIQSFESFAATTIEADVTEDGTFDLVIGNPPFTLADVHIPLMLKLLRSEGVCAMLLSMTFFGGQERIDTLWRRTMKGVIPAHEDTPVEVLTTLEPLPRLRYIWPLRGRPRFVGDGTGKSDYAIYIFDAAYDGPTITLPHLVIPL